MPDFGLYRAAFVPALLAFVALMFSLQGIPLPLEPALPPAAFEPGRAAATARAIVSAAPERPPGSEGDATAAEIVADGFTSVRAGTVSEQEVGGSFDGASVTLRNVLITLPGDSPATVLVLAGRDSPRGPGAASSAAASGALVELASTLGVAGHARTFVLASTASDAAGAGAARAVIAALPDPEALEAVVVLNAPGAAEARPPFVVASSTGPSRTAAQLTATAVRAISEQAGLEDERPGPLTQLARLAFPSGLGLQAPLIDAGHDAVAISAAGERPLDPADDTLDDLSRQALDRFGRAATSVVHALDVAEGPLDHGPEPYVEVGDNLVPGWAIALLALALLLPSGVASVDTLARSTRRGGGLGAALTRAAPLAGPALAGLLALYALGILGLVPRPGFPFDPGRYGPDAAAFASMVLIVAATVGGGLLASRRRSPQLPARPARVAAAGILSTFAGLLAWIANPFLALLVAPAAHVWLLAAWGRVRVPGVAAAAALSIAPVVVALASIAALLDLGGAAPWTFVVMIADGQIGFWTAASLCLMTGALAASVAATRPDRRPSRAPLRSHP